MTNRSLFDKTFRDKHGKITIYQAPNIPVETWFISAVLAKIIAHGKAHDLFLDITFGALVSWALMEIFTGTNYFRRALGAAVLGFILYGKL